MHHTDVAIIGFGFAGLATLLELSETDPGPRVTVIAEDVSGHGLAYRTTDPSHLLNVVAGQMSARPEDPDHFAGWLTTTAAQRACEQLRVPVPGALQFAPRALYAHYLDDLRAQAVAQFSERGGSINWIRARATELQPSDAGWTVTTCAARIDATVVVLAVGNDPRHVFGDLRHPRLWDGPWDLTVDDLPNDGRPLVLIGSGLTAVDAVLSARRLGFTGAIIALSRGGNLPQAHDPELPDAPSLEDPVADVETLDEFISLAREFHAAGHDWRSLLDALRPFTSQTWQRLSPEDQQDAADRWAGAWNVHRHRMAPRIAAQIAAEIDRGSLRIIATQEIKPTLVDGDLGIAYQPKRDPDGPAERLRPVAVIDCTGPQLEPGQSEQPLLRSLIEEGHCSPHHTGLGFSANSQQQIAERLYLLGSLLTGQLWETIAVPELRAQAALVSASARQDLRLGAQSGDQQLSSPLQ